ncbi:hypothetical protein [Nostoc sp.]
MKCLVPSDGITISPLKQAIAPIIKGRLTVGDALRVRHRSPTQFLEEKRAIAPIIKGRLTVGDALRVRHRSRNS